MKFYAAVAELFLTGGSAEGMGLRSTVAELVPQKQDKVAWRGREVSHKGHWSREGSGNKPPLCLELKKML